MVIRLMPFIGLWEQARFWNQVNKKNENECWLWKGSQDSRKRGIIKLNNVSYKTSRIAYYLHYKEDPKELCVLHKCDNPLCCNPNHLFLGTQLDNIEDREIKERGVINYGNNSPNHKLSQQEADEIREIYKTGRYTQRYLAELYDIHQCQIHNIVNNKTWNKE